MDAKTQFQRDWLEVNWDKFVAEGIEDSHGRLITVADALADISEDDHRAINAAFSIESGYLWCTVERIAKTYLLEVVASELWNNHLAEIEDKQRQYKGELAEVAFENYDMSRSRHDERI